MPNPVSKSPRLIRRGDVVKIKGTNQDEIVRGVAVVLQLANGMNESYDSGELVVMGVDTDLSPDELVEAAAIDATERVVKTIAADAAAAASAAAAAASAEAAAAYAAAQEQAQQDQNQQVPPE